MYRQHCDVLAWYWHDCNSEDRIRKSCEKLTKNVKAATQSRMSDFFKSVPATNTTGNALKKRKDAPEVSLYQTYTCNMLIIFN